MVHVGGGCLHDYIHVCPALNRHIDLMCHPLPLRRYSMIAMVVEVHTPVAHCEVAQAFE